MLIFPTELWNESQALKQKGKKFDSLHPDRKKKPVTVSDILSIFSVLIHNLEVLHYFNTQNSNILYISLIKSF